MKIDWVSKLRHLLQVWAFALMIATVQYAFMPDRPYGPPLVYSLFIATITWAVIDLGRHMLPSSAETGWPQGWTGLALVLGGIVAGYLGGTRIADALCVYYGWYPPDAGHQDPAQLRSSILITAIAGIAGSFYFYTINKSAYLQRKMTEARQHASEARLKLLETQLEPHMLFNTLANLRALIATDPPRAQVMLDHMIAYLRATLGASLQATHSLQDEFERVRDYLELMAIRMGPRLSYTLDLPPELTQHPVPTLLLQPLVENCIKHGLEPKVEGGSISVSARVEGADIVLDVTDTGIGLSGAESGRTGFGIAQVRERLASTHGAQSAIELVAVSAGGTRATARFPYKP
ncbi:MAG: histidine kinase [Polaromonas sp.]|uniref:sensor histidine kinase n=1 Tax=Polaromonas sp. TaxID=1869339 RepID=UPI001799305F|nr:histidine kinase [Polaromonas sp.]MBA3595540.1 histidine kinase [Polaromonas sp.]